MTTSDSASRNMTNTAPFTGNWSTTGFIRLRPLDGVTVILTVHRQRRTDTGE